MSEAERREWFTIGAGIFATMESYNFAIKNFKLGRAADLYRGRKKKKKKKERKNGRKNRTIIRIANRRKSQNWFDMG